MTDRNLSAAVLASPLNEAGQEQQAFNLILTRYGLKRILHRGWANQSMPGTFLPPRNDALQRRLLNPLLVLGVSAVQLLRPNRCWLSRRTVKGARSTHQHASDATARQDASCRAM